MDEFVALFCPNCGVTLNDSEMFELSVDVDEEPDYGSYYICGWCKATTRDWNHVKQCRALHRLKDQLTRTELVGDLSRLLGELSDV